MARSNEVPGMREFELDIVAQSFRRVAHRGTDLDEGGPSFFDRQFLRVPGDVFSKWAASISVSRGRPHTPNDVERLINGRSSSAKARR